MRPRVPGALGVPQLSHSCVLTGSGGSRIQPPSHTAGGERSPTMRSILAAVAVAGVAALAGCVSDLAARSLGAIPVVVRGEPESWDGDKDLLVDPLPEECHHGPGKTGGGGPAASP